MAKILYAASGDGLGHAVRLHGVGGGLIARGHDVRFISSAKTVAYLRQYFPDRVYETFGLFTIYNQGRVELLATLCHNLRRAFDDMTPLNRTLRHVLRTFKPDLVITDFEPFTAFWARLHGIPYISLDNQHLLTHCDVEHLPGCFSDLLSAYFTIRMYYGGAKRYLITTFFNVPIRHHPTRLIPPVLRPEVYEKQSTEGDYLLAYKGANGHNEGMRTTLEQFDRLPIRAYGFDREGTRGHLTYKPPNTSEFLSDLSGCRAVISTAGHSLVCESLHLGKPLLLQPIQGQYEQALNGYYVQRMGFGKVCHRLQTSDIELFLGRYSEYRAALGSIPKPSLAIVIDAVEDEIA